ncbi:7737_t:CDS:2 [Scutellospora calospora]|uniref:7737_t:CDS:1 n=1 Tax=Scutellospora calospora TaxID=85575 RepID=A0ACA9JVH5_9GLOM|nr:7737_t:CDS:2 [Scutellospora calospora]
MADVQETKLKYRRGACFSCRKCMFCGIGLQQEKCNCDLFNVSYREEKYYWKSNKKGYSKKEFENYDDNEFLSDDEIEIEFTYRVFIKLENGISLPAKWYTT